MRNWLRWFAAAALLAGVTVLLSILLLRAPAEVSFRFRTPRPAELKCYPSRPMDRAIDTKEYPVRLPPSAGPSSERFTVTIPLACLRRIRLELPPETELDLLECSWNFMGWLRGRVSGKELLSGKAHTGLRQLVVEAPETEFPVYPRLQTDAQAGRWECTLTNDLPRLLGMLPALFAGISAAAILLVLTGPRRSESLKYLLAGEFLILLFGGTVAARLSGGIPAGQPEWTLWSLSEYPARFSTWYKRNLPFRDSLFRLYYHFCSGCGISPVSRVWRGQEDWLFIHQFSRQTPYEDYLGINLFTEDELRKIQSRLERAQEQLRKRNIRFALFIAPGKLHVCGDHLKPVFRRCDPTGPTRARQLVAYLRKHSTIPVEYPLDELLAASKRHPVPLYYRHDTHWNYLGGTLGARAMMRLIDPSVRLSDPERMEIYADGRHRGDLARMIEAPDSLLEPEWKFRHPDFRYDIRANYAGFSAIPGGCAAGKRVFFIRDSFLTHMMPALYGRLSRAAFYWDYSLNLPMIEEERPEVVILQVVDRYLASLERFGETDIRLLSGGRML